MTTRTFDLPETTVGGRLTIDLGALRANYVALAAAVAPSRCASVVKADAYGLGAVEVARELYHVQCRDFFVAHLHEGLELRPHLPADTAVYVLNGLQPGGEPACAQAGLVPVLNGVEQVEAWACLCARRGRKLPAAIQVDSGMSRLGLSADEIDLIMGDRGLLEALDVRLVMSHLACADEPDHPINDEQRRTFDRLARRFPAALVSLANSGGVTLGKAFHHDLARPGIALYGVSPTPAPSIDLRPVVRLDARVIQLREVAAGAAVGYGASFVADRPTRLAVVAVGYADGWPRHLSDVGAAYVGDTRLPIAGRVSMDSTILDVTDLPEGHLQLGSFVELVGPHQSLDDIARLAGTIPYEILTRLGRRFARRYVEGRAERASVSHEVRAA